MNGQGIFKSDIQLVLEHRAMIESLRNHVRDFIKYYDTDNAIFGLVNNRPQELTTNYLYVTKEFDNLNEALNNLNSLDSAIQLLGRESNRKYRVGTVKNNTTEVNKNSIVNIETLQDLRDEFINDAVSEAKKEDLNKFKIQDVAYFILNDKIRCGIVKRITTGLYGENLHIDHGNSNNTLLATKCYKSLEQLEDTLYSEVNDDRRRLHIKK